MFARIDLDPGRLDIIVNNSGVKHRRLLADLQDKDIAEIVGINMLGPLYIASEAAKRLSDNGRIIISAQRRQVPARRAGLYSAAKKAVESFTESWAKELGARGINGQLRDPGATSPGYDRRLARISRFLRLGLAVQADRPGRRNRRAGAFLASPEASWVTGGTILANGAATT